MGEQVAAGSKENKRETFSDRTGFWGKAGANPHQQGSAVEIKRKAGMPEARRWFYQ